MARASRSASPAILSQKPRPSDEDQRSDGSVPLLVACQISLPAGILLGRAVPER